jgi:hypothetical protein
MSVALIGSKKETQAVKLVTHCSSAAGRHAILGGGVLGAGVGSGKRASTKQPGLSPSAQRVLFLAPQLSGEGEEKRSDAGKWVHGGATAGAAGAKIPN